MVMWNNILLILPVVVPVLAGLLAWCIKSRSARNALTGASLVINQSYDFQANPLP